MDIAAYHVHENTKNTGGNVLMLGDMNAADPYFGQYDKEHCFLYKQSNLGSGRKNLFKWLITNDMHTNVKRTKAYDR